MISILKAQMEFPLPLILSCDVPSLVNMYTTSKVLNTQLGSKDVLLLLFDTHIRGIHIGSEEHKLIMPARGTTNFNLLIVYLSKYYYTPLSGKILDKETLIIRACSYGILDEL